MSRRPPRLGRRRVATDATIEPEPAPPPEVVFDRLSGPYVRRTAQGLPGRAARDEAT